MSPCLVSFRGDEAPTWVLDGIRSGRVPGVCLFAYNFRDLAQFRRLTASLHQAAQQGGQLPPLVGIDQEGGQLMAISGGATELPGNMALGATGSPAMAEIAGRILGRELADLGCNLNFAPVLDLASQPRSQSVGLRAFGDDPALVAGLGTAIIAAMQAEGVLATAKHFPGHGHTAQDSHHGDTVVNRSLEELLTFDLAPFVAAIKAGVAAVMTAHVRYPQLDVLPATFSRVIVHELLRERLGFGGLVITDALDMHALQDTQPLHRALRALEAGCDLALLGHMAEQEAMLGPLHDAADPASLERIIQARSRLAPFDPQDLTLDGGPEGPQLWAEHRPQAQRLTEASITVSQGRDRLPLRLEPEQRLCVVTVRAGNLTPAETAAEAQNLLARQVARRHGELTVRELPYGASEREIEAVLAACQGAAAVVVATVNAVTDPAQQRLLRRLHASGQRPYVLALRSPADGWGLHGAAAVVCSYGRRPLQTEAAVAVLFGEREASGRLPIDLTMELAGMDA